MGLSRRDDIGQDKEGELALKLLVDRNVVFVLACTIVPGQVVGSTATHAVLISRLQGVKGCYDEITLATRAFREVAPAALLVAALRGVAEACEVTALAGVCAERQVNYSDELSAAFARTYDDFFSELGAARNPAGFYLSPLPLEEKPLALIKKGHKKRTKEKRAFKQQVATGICARILGNA
jgi:uncharacterized protein VirK/YbjX